MDVELYSWQFCPFAQRTRIALEVKGVDYLVHEIDITKPYPQDFLGHNPNGQVPTLLYKGLALYESDVLGEFINEAFKGPDLLSPDSVKRALARTLISMCNGRIIPLLYRLLLNQDETQDKVLEGQLFKHLADISQFLKKNASTTGYFFEDPSLCEYAIGPFFQRLDVAFYYRNIEIPTDYKYHHIRRWREACLGLPIIKETAPDLHSLIKLYADYARGYAQGTIPDSEQYSSFDIEALPLAERNLPPIGTRFNRELENTSNSHVQQRLA